MSKHPPKTRAQTRVATLSLEKQNIIRVKFRDDHEVTPEDVKEILRKSDELAGGIRFCFLVEMSKTNHAGNEAAQRYAADNVHCKQRIADAIVVTNVALKLAAGFYIQFYKPRVPTRVFTSNEKALAWLRSLQGNHLLPKKKTPPYGRVS